MVKNYVDQISGMDCIWAWVCLALQRKSTTKYSLIAISNELNLTRQTQYRVSVSSLDLEQRESHRLQLVERPLVEGRVEHRGVWVAEHVHCQGRRPTDLRPDGVSHCRDNLCAVSIKLFSKILANQNKQKNIYMVKTL